MKKLLFSALLFAAPLLAAANSGPIAIAVHGGAGASPNLSKEQSDEYEAKLTEALQAGHKILADGGSSLDAVEAAVRILEDSPLFNADHGAVLNNEGNVELDASIMDGRTLEGRAIAAVKHIKNPISLARLVLHESPHVLLVGDGAEVFAREHGVDFVENEYFRTERRINQWRRVHEREQRKVNEEAMFDGIPDYKHGTVGAVALDADGNLAAATSTGGRNYKSFGRIGDSPIIGAGTYADNETCAVSATGHGEYFIRGAIAYDISAVMRYTGASVTEAAESRIHEKLTNMGGTGGVIAIDRNGNISMPFNTEAMHRGKIDTDGNLTVGRLPDSN